MFRVKTKPACMPTNDRWQKIKQRRKISSDRSQDSRGNMKHEHALLLCLAQPLTVCLTIGPASILSTVNSTVTPVLVSPASRHR